MVSLSNFFFPNAFRLTKSDFCEPVNIGSDEMVSMNEMAEIVLGFENKELPIHHIPGPEGVRGRNSDNTLIKEKLGWAPTMRLKVPSQSFVQFSCVLSHAN
jgi:GDP-D-mannose 3',5'-epimerase